jgi:hypothetical protein
MRHRVVVEVEAHIGRLADLDGDPLDQRIGIVRQGEQSRRLIEEDLMHRICWLFWTRPVCRSAIAPDRSLGVEIVDINKMARCKEAVADIANRTLDAAFFIAARHRDRAGLIAIVRGKRQQRRVEANGVTLAFQHRAFKIIVQLNTRTALPCCESSDMSAQEALQARVKEEAQEDLTRVAQHHDKGHQRPAGATDGEMAEVAPVHLGLLADEAAQPQIGLGRLPRAMAGHQVAEVIGPTAVAALAHHGVETAGGECRELLKRRQDERQ